jgi:hypothetical protein
MFYYFIIVYLWIDKIEHLFAISLFCNIEPAERTIFTFK